MNIFQHGKWESRAFSAIVDGFEIKHTPSLSLHLFAVESYRTRSMPLAVRLVRTKTEGSMKLSHSTPLSPSPTPHLSVWLTVSYFMRLYSAPQDIVWRRQ